MLMEIAPGVRVKEDVLDQMDFEPLISDKLKQMHRSLFDENVIGLMN